MSQHDQRHMYDFIYAFDMICTFDTMHYLYDKLHCLPWVTVEAVAITNDEVVEDSVVESVLVK